MIARGICVSVQSNYVHLIAFGLFVFARPIFSAAPTPTAAVAFERGSFTDEPWPFRLRNAIVCGIAKNGIKCRPKEAAVAFFRPRPKGSNENHFKLLFSHPSPFAHISAYVCVRPVRNSHRPKCEPQKNHL